MTLYWRDQDSEITINPSTLSGQAQEASSHMPVEVVEPGQLPVRAPSTQPMPTTGVKSALWNWATAAWSNAKQYGTASTETVLQHVGPFNISSGRAPSAKKHPA